MTITDYLAARNESNAAFARRAGVSVKTIERLRAGEGCQLRVAERIVRASHDVPAPSDGWIRFEDLCPVEAAESAA